MNPSNSRKPASPPPHAFTAFSLGAVCTSLALLSGCVVDERPRHYHPAPPPPPVVEIQQAPPPPGEVIVVSPPPAPRVEVITVRPSHRHIWLAGHWRYYGGRYVWIAGHWELPPRAHAVYVNPHWEARGGGHVFIEGYWRP